VAIEIEHRDSITRERLSGYYLASVVSADYGGMMIALPENDGRAASARSRQNNSPHTSALAPTTFVPTRSAKTCADPSVQAQAIQRCNRPSRFHRRLIAEQKMTASQG